MTDQDDAPSANAVEPAAASSSDKPARREFLKASAAVTGASLLGGCLTDTNTAQSPTADAAPASGFEHLVV